MSVQFAEVTIANNAAASNAFDLKGHRIVAILTPSAWTAADITFEVETKQNSGTYVKVVNRAGAIYKLTGIATGAAECNLISGDANQGDIIITSLGRAKVVSTNTASEADVNQGGARSLTVLMMPLSYTGI